MRPDEGDPSSLFRFLEDGQVEAVHPDSEAAWTITDLNLREPWLVACRKLVIEKMLADLRSLLEDEELPAPTKLRLARNHFRRLDDPSLAYSAALRQCFEREWAAAFPGLPL